MNNTEMIDAGTLNAGDGDENCFEWVRACGGPKITPEKDGHHVKGLPESGWWAFGDWLNKGSGLLRNSLCLHTPNAGGLILITLRAVKTGCAWNISYKVGDQFPTRASGSSESFWEAHAAATTWRPEVIRIGGTEFWKSTHALDVTWEGGPITITRNDDKFGWQHDVPVEAQKLVDVLGGYCDICGQGFASLKDAGVDALGVPERLRRAAADIVFSSTAERDLWAAFQLGMKHGATITNAPASTPGETA